jgi:hypothetical protein
MPSADRKRCKRRTPPSPKCNNGRTAVEGIPRPAHGNRLRRRPATRLKQTGQTAGLTLGRPKANGSNGRRDRGPSEKQTVMKVRQPGKACSSGRWLTDELATVLCGRAECKRLKRWPSVRPAETKRCSRLERSAGRRGWRRSAIVLGPMTNDSNGGAGGRSTNGVIGERGNHASGPRLPGVGENGRIAAGNDSG